MTLTGLVALSSHIGPLAAPSPESPHFVLKLRSTSPGRSKYLQIRYSILNIATDGLMCSSGQELG